MTRIHDHVHAIELHLSAIADAFAEPTAALFTTNADILPTLERTHNLKTGIDAAIAYAADQARAGDRVGSPNNVDYLTSELGIPVGEAIGRLRLGHHNHGIIAPPQPEPEPEPLPEPDTDAEQESDEDHPTQDERRRRAEAEQAAAQQRLREQQQAAEEARRKQEAARDHARRKARQTRIGPQKLTAIRRELENLNPRAKQQHHQLYAAAIDEAGKRELNDLREWIRNRVIRTNRANHDPTAAWKRRKLIIGPQDHDGGAAISGYVTGDVLARLDTALAPAQKPGHLIDDPTVKDDRSLAQRRHDALAVILHNHTAEKITPGGTGTVVISMSAKDIDEMANPEADHRYPTNTSAMLTPADILRLGATKYNFVVVHDSETGNPLDVRRTKRLATVEQRMALLATQLVCTNPDCTEPFCNCEIHHLKSWKFGGTTDIWNLTTLCRPHHARNRDQRDGQGARGHSERDPDTGRVGTTPPPRPGNPHPAVQLNNTERQEQSGGAKVRRQQWPSHSLTGDTPSQPPPGDNPARPVPPRRAPHSTPSFDDVPPTPPPPLGRPEPPEQPPLFPLNDTG